MGVQLDPRFWTMAEDLVKQRMRDKEWASILLAQRDTITRKGRLRQLIAKKLGFGVVEVSLKPLENIVGDKV